MMNRKQRRAGGTRNNVGTGNKPTPSGSAIIAGLKAQPMRRAATDQATLAAVAITLADDMEAQGNWTAAADIYRDLLARDRDNAAALYNLGYLLYRNGLWDEAARCLARFLRRMPDDSRALTVLACVKVGQGLIGEAVSLADRALRLDPPGQALSKLGAVYNVAGKQAEAQQVWAAAIEKDPECTDAYLHLQKLRKFEPGDPHFIQMIAQEAKGDRLSLEDRIFLEFALGQAFLDQNDPDRAFGHYAEANRLKRGTYPGYDIGRVESAADDIILLFDRAFIDRHSGGPTTGTGRPIFVVGMPRSGSTLVERILSSHPDAGSVGESPAFSDSLPLAEGAAPRRPAMTAWLADNLSTGLLKKIAKKYLSATLSTGGAPGTNGRCGHVVDKMLLNYLHIGLIRLALPEAKIIHCRRDPVDVGFSIWQTIFEPDIPWAYDMREIGRYYRAYARIMAHWNKIFPGDIYTADYEALVTNQEAETRRLLSFCGLAWDDRCLRFHENEQPVNTASTAQVRRPLYKDSARKWKKYEKHLGPLIEALGDAVF